MDRLDQPEAEYAEQPWPTNEEVEWQRAEFEARAWWYGYGAQDDGE